jgi:hypothetical protein
MRIFRIFWIFKNFNVLSVNTIIGRLMVSCRGLEICRTATYQDIKGLPHASLLALQTAAAQHTFVSRNCTKAVLTQECHSCYQAM